MGAGLVFYNLVHNHQLVEDFVGGLWGPGEFQSQRSSLDPFQQGRRNSRWVLAQVPWTGPEEGLGDWSGQQNPLNPCLGPLPESVPWSLPSLVWPLCHQFAVGFCTKSLFYLGLSFPSCHMGSLVLSPWSNVGMEEVTLEWKTLSKL